MVAELTRPNVNGLGQVFAEATNILILSHDNPDPDALASAFVMQAILAELSPTPCTVGFAGMIGRAENRAMLRELQLTPDRLSDLDIDEFDAIALVDTQPGFGNNSLPPDRVPHAVIDHHPPKGELAGVQFVDIREDYGATSTIIAEYAYDLGLRLDDRLVTALFYALRSETQDLGRDSSDKDEMIYLSLFPRADKESLARIQRARVPRQYFRAVEEAIGSAMVYGRTVLTDLGRVEHPDIVAEIADFLLRLEGADWSCCLARYDQQLVLSLRTTDPEAHAGRVIRNVVRGLGSAGGHGMSAGGRIRLSDDESYPELASEVAERVLEEVGSKRHPGEPLVIA